MLCLPPLFSRAQSLCKACALHPILAREPSFLPSSGIQDLQLSASQNLCANATVHRLSYCVVRRPFQVLKVSLMQVPGLTRFCEAPYLDHENGGNRPTTLTCSSTFEIQSQFFLPQAKPPKDRSGRVCRVPESFRNFRKAPMVVLGMLCTFVHSQ